QVCPDVLPIRPRAPVRAGLAQAVVSAGEVHEAARSETRREKVVGRVGGGSPANENVVGEAVSWEVRGQGCQYVAAGVIATRTAVVYNAIVRAHKPGPGASAAVVDLG